LTQATGRIPFFFEPNFTAKVEPLAAAIRVHEKEGVNSKEAKNYQPTIYGDFLMKKVGNNFAGGGKY
jgi:isopenicillin N synthase-like dioxygenase